MPSNFNLDPEEELFFLFVCLTYELLSKSFTGYFKRTYALTPIQMSAVAYVKAHAGLSMTELAHKLNISKQQATQLAATLVKRDFVKRCDDLENRRIVRIVPTDKTIEVFSEVEKQYTKNALAQINELPAEERQATMEAMRVLTKTLYKCNFEFK